MYGGFANGIHSEDDFYALAKEMRLVFTQAIIQSGEDADTVLPAVLCRDLFAKEIEAEGSDGGFY